MLSTLGTATEWLAFGLSMAYLGMLALAAIRQGITDARVRVQVWQAKR